MNDLLPAALAFRQAGCSVAPTRVDGSKAPASFWKQYQQRAPTVEELSAWFEQDNFDGLGLICGAVSGGLELFELEGRAVAEGYLQRLATALTDHGLADLWARICTGYLENTPSGGLHILYRVTGKPRGNTKLASRPARPDELNDAEQAVFAKNPAKAFARVLLETRGEGGFVVVAPSGGRTHPTGKPWALLTGGPATIATITEDERDALYAIASLLDEMPAAPQVSAAPVGQRTLAAADDGAIRPGDDYSAKTTWAEILEPHGWTCVGSYGGRGRTWCRPGKNIGISATTGTRGDGDNLYVWSSSTEFDCEVPYSKFGAYALLEYGGDHGAAARALRRDGYGGELPPRDDEGLESLVVRSPGYEGNLATVTELRPAPRPSKTYGHEQHRGQLRFAERFTTTFGGEYLHVHGIGWHRFDGARWAECLDGAERRAVLELIKEAFGELQGLDSDARKDLFKDIGKVESAAGLKGVLELAESMHPCTLAGSRLDASPYLLNTLTGTVHIEAGKVTPPNPGDHLSKVTRAGFDPDARSAVFEEFLERIQPDAEMRAFLARQLGSSLLGVVREHVLFIWHGLGANGKGTLRDAILHALGDYAVEVPAELLLVSRNSNLAPERMRLKGARVAFCSEIGNGAKLDEPTMKKLTGGDPVNAKMLYRNPIQFDPSHTLFMLTNHLPQVRGDDPATWRRIVAVPFDTVIPEGERDGRLPERLKAVPDAILAWMWRGWLDYQAQGLNPPQAVLNATRKYQLDSDLLARFLADEEAVCLGHGSVNSAVLYRAFTDWCKAEGEEAGMTNKAFTEALEGRGHRKKRTNTGAMWDHIMVVDKTPGRDPSDGW